MLHWLSFIGDISNVCASLFAHKLGHLFHSATNWPILLLITWLTRPYIVDAPMTHIFRMGQWASHILFYLYRRPLLRLWMLATNRHSDYPTHNTNNRWPSLDAHFQDGVGNMSLFVLVINAANTLQKIMQHGCQYFVIITGISECDHQSTHLKCRTGDWNWRV